MITITSKFLVLLFIPVWLLVMLFFGTATGNSTIRRMAFYGLMISGVVTLFLIAAYTNQENEARRQSFHAIQTRESEKSQDYFLQGVDQLGQMDSSGIRNYTKALALFDMAIQINPVHVEAKYWKTQCEIHLYQLDRAYCTVESAIGDCKNAANQLLPDLYVLAGAIEVERGNRRKAHQYWKKAKLIYQSRVDKESHNVMAIVNKAVVLCYMDRKIEALKFIQTNLTGENNSFIFNETREWIAGFESCNVLDDVMNRRYRFH